MVSERNFLGNVYKKETHFIKLQVLFVQELISTKSNLFYYPFYKPLYKKYYQVPYTCESNHNRFIVDYLVITVWYQCAGSDR